MRSREDWLFIVLGFCQEFFSKKVKVKRQKEKPDSQKMSESRARLIADEFCFSLLPFYFYLFPC
jgi:hypothetical protein